MNKQQIKRRIANPGERACYEHVYAICNAFGAIAFVNADNEQDALDTAADSGRLDSELMLDDDYAEHEANGWDDSYILLGNASEPFHSVYLSIHTIK